MITEKSGLGSCEKVRVLTYEIDQNASTPAYATYNRWYVDAKGCPSEVKFRGAFRLIDIYALTESVLIRIDAINSIQLQASQYTHKVLSSVGSVLLTSYDLKPTLWSDLKGTKV